ncbi:hypothetical protein CC85DRAFT_287016 [Cutaneotrichosporon oleaginosum]|uniref:Uncharacterized protein n=1 Tax=Cutaneotrichosporon oleaginosum TaxID=879819 RepID=A0A0J0XIB6_9TREE|nr:uncharacterized protein CC85DRAFT_287016 [Cutaneotrichosporon oleaginosum]KLT40870.1 hypothetical protein CC85DRAFT_287016 [Cutaneotrichosporon oleaginosum]TXT09270.1 hypothetical protein COLE_03204 [Cutaneotrichosporon oleaginosum]
MLSLPVFRLCVFAFAVVFVCTSVLLTLHGPRSHPSSRLPATACDAARSVHPNYVAHTFGETHFLPGCAHRVGRISSHHWSQYFTAYCTVHEV